MLLKYNYPKIIMGQQWYFSEHTECLKYHDQAVITSSWDLDLQGVY